MSKEEVLEKHTRMSEEDSYGYGSENVLLGVPVKNVTAAMQEYADLQTASLQAEKAELLEALEEYVDILWLSVGNGKFTAEIGSAYGKARDLLAKHTK